jgi:hypothetical protein
MLWQETLPLVAVLGLELVLAGCSRAILDLVIPATTLKISNVISGSWRIMSRQNIVYQQTCFAKKGSIVATSPTTFTTWARLRVNTAWPAGDMRPMFLPDSPS